MLVTGKKKMRNARELAFDQVETAHLIRLLDASCPIDLRGASCDAVFASIEKQADKIGSQVYRQLKVSEISNLFDSLSDLSKVDTVTALILVINGVSNSVDLTSCGGSKSAGDLQPNYSKLLSDPNRSFVIIDQSITGMFERRTRIGL